MIEDLAQISLKTRTEEVPTHRLPGFYGKTKDILHVVRSEILSAYGDMLHFPITLPYLLSDGETLDDMITESRVVLPVSVVSGSFTNAAEAYLVEQSKKQGYLQEDGLPMNIVKRLIKAPVEYNGALKRLSKEWTEPVDMTRRMEWNLFLFQQENGFPYSLRSQTPIKPQPDTENP